MNDEAIKLAAELLIPFQDNFHEVCESASAKLVDLAFIEQDCDRLKAEIERLKAENTELKALADSEGTRAVEYLRRARKAEAENEGLRRDVGRYVKLVRLTDDGDLYLCRVDIIDNFGATEEYQFNDKAELDAWLDAAISLGKSSQS